MYSAWLVPTLWIPAYAGMTVREAGMTVWDAGMTVWDAGNDGPLCIPPLWIADQVRNDGVCARVEVVGIWLLLIMVDFQDFDDALHRFHPLIPCQALGQALVLSHQGRGGFCRLVCLVSPTLWISAYAGMTVRDAGNDGRFWKGLRGK